MKTTDQTLSDQQLFLLAHRRHHHFVHFSRIFMLLLFLTVWELFADFHIIDSFFFSSPSRVVACFVRMVSERSLFTHIGITLTETVISFFLVALVSLSAATLLWYSRRLSEILEPFLVVLNSLPKSALAPLLIVWLGTGMDTIIAAGISVAIFGAIINLYTGFLQADPKKLLLIRTLGGTRRDCFFKVVLPASIPEEERTEQKKGSERNGSAASLCFFCFPSYAATSPVSIAAIHFIHLPLSLNF